MQDAKQKLFDLSAALLKDPSVPDDERKLAQAVVDLVRENRELSTVAENYKAIVPPLKHFHDEAVKALGYFSKPYLTLAEQEVAVRKCREIARQLQVPPIPTF